MSECPAEWKEGAGEMDVDEGRSHGEMNVEVVSVFWALTRWVAASEVASERYLLLGGEVKEGARLHASGVHSCT